MLYEVITAKYMAANVPGIDVVDLDVGEAPRTVTADEIAIVVELLV